MNPVSRGIALRVLSRVLQEGETLDEALATVTGEVSGAERGWLTEVTSGTLRWKGRLDWIIDSIADKKRPTGWLRRVLLLAAYQVVAQDRINAVAVVNETVDLVRSKEGEAPAKFANAVLRKVSEQADAWRVWQAPIGATPAESAASCSLPEWMWWKFKKERGEEWARAYGQACLERPVTWVRAKHILTWAQPGPIAQSHCVSEGGPITAKPGFEAGEFFVQDISSQTLVHDIAALVLAARHEESPGAIVRALDLCAAPGGKSAGLSWSGLTVSASDAEPPRYALLRDTVRRVAPEVNVIERDQVAALPLFDLVWVDAPCTGSGILRRHPDVRWVRQEKDLLALKKIQAALLSQAWERVAPGGFLVYSVCSLFKEEGEFQLAAFADRHQTAVVKTWELGPHLAPNGDGFFAGILKKA